MNSLRARLVLAFSLVAIVPLVVSMLLLSQHIRRTVRTQAAERLVDATAVLESRLHADAAQTLEKLEILAGDPLLKRSYLVSPARHELEQYLEERRLLLGFDFLVLAEPGGAVVAEATGDSIVVPESGWARAAAPASPAFGIEVRSAPGTPALAMMASVPILYQRETVGMLAGGHVLDANFLTRLARAGGFDLVLRDGAGRSVASTIRGDAGDDDVAFGAAPVEINRGRSLALRFPIVAAAASQGTLTALVSTAAAERTIARLQATSLSLAGLGVGIAIVLGSLWSFSLSRPVERLARFSQRIAQGDWDEPLALHSVKELEMLVEALERMRRDLHGYRERLVASERHAAWSLMARKVAHEVRNPLTPIAVSIADLKRSHDQGRPDFPQILDQAVRTIGEEVQTLKRMLQEFSDFGRLPEASFAECRVEELLANVEALYSADVATGRLQIVRPHAPTTFTADGAQLVQALVNLVQNGFEAVGERGQVRIAASRKGDSIALEIADDGPGLDATQRANLFVPNFTTKKHGSGLGLTIVERIVTDHGGTIAVQSEPGHGTTFRILIPIRRATT